MNANGKSQKLPPIYNMVENLFIQIILYLKLHVLYGCENFCIFIIICSNFLFSLYRQSSG